MDTLEKLPRVLDAVLEIERAKNEEEALVQAVLSLERLGYVRVMISFLRTLDGFQYIVGDAKLTSDPKWKAIAGKTKRIFEPPTDLLPHVLHRRQARFVLDSRNDPLRENDVILCKEMGIVTQYVMPLATDSMLIGTLQVDMGERPEQPKDECMMLDALAAHLSIAIERHRALLLLHTAHNELNSKSKLIAYEAAAANIMHALSHSVGDYAKRLQTILKSPTIRSNKDAIAFLEFTNRCVGEWIDELETHTVSFRRKETVEWHSLQEVAREVIDAWHRKASLWNCSITEDFTSEPLSIRARRGALKELVSCLIVNAIEANARHIWVVARLRSPPQGKSTIELVIRDDGDGVPLEYQTAIFELGWTTKSKRGHGIGLTIVSLLAKEMGGTFELRAFGKSADQKLTEFAIVIPYVPPPKT